MNNRKPPSVVGAGLIGLGIILLGIVAGFMLYDRLAGWVTTQPDPPNVVAIVETVAPLLALSPSLPLDAPLVVETPFPTDAPSSATVSPALSPAALPRQPAAAIPTRRPAAPAQLIIPKLNITRAIVSVDRVTRNGQTDWDTDKLFATRDRPDLVGHLKGTGGLGAAGNTVLAGHNYNRGQYNWRGVFYPVGRLSKGDLIYVVSQDNERFAYQVVQVEKVNWPPRSAADTQKHVEHLTATTDETLTLVTCGGATLAPFPARLYITAKPIREPAIADALTLTATPGATTPVLSQAPAVATRPRVTPTATRQATPTPRPDCRATVTVKRGDTLARIARANAVSMTSLARKNGITNPDQIRVGQRLCIP